MLGEPVALARLNAIVWPLMGEARAAFFAAARAADAEVVVLDIPLLLETGGEKNVDAVVVVSAPAAMQRERVLARPGMNEAKFDAVLAAQMPDADKRARADFIIDTSGTLDHTDEQVKAILDTLRAGAEREH